jgi:hypothetical protein
MLVSLFDSLAEIFIGSDVVTVEDGPLAVTADRHCNSFTYSGADDVPNSGAPKVVKET